VSNGQRTDTRTSSRPTLRGILLRIAYWFEGSIFRFTQGTSRNSTPVLQFLVPSRYLQLRPCMSVEIPRVPIVLQFRGFIEIHPRSSSSAETLDGAQVVLATSGTPNKQRETEKRASFWSPGEFLGPNWRQLLFYCTNIKNIPSYSTGNPCIACCIITLASCKSNTARTAKAWAGSADPSEGVQTRPSGSRGVWGFPKQKRRNPGYR
jgi:hypothetical protein